MPTVRVLCRGDELNVWTRDMLRPPTTMRGSLDAHRRTPTARGVRPATSYSHWGRGEHGSGVPGATLRRTSTTRAAHRRLAWKGEAVVVGACNSATNRADLGAGQVTSCQRSSTYIMSQRHASRHLRQQLRRGRSARSTRPAASGTPCPTLRARKQASRTSVPCRPARLARRRASSATRPMARPDGYALATVRLLHRLGASRFIAEGRIGLAQEQALPSTPAGAAVGRRALDADLVARDGYRNAETRDGSSATSGRPVAAVLGIGGTARSASYGDRPPLLVHGGPLPGSGYSKHWLCRSRQASDPALIRMVMRLVDTRPGRRPHRRVRGWLVSRAEQTCLTH